MAAARRPAAGAKPRGGGGGGAGRRSAWLAADGSKRWGEAFFLLYTPFWLTLCLGVVVPFKLYERFTELEYLILGLVSTVPAFLIPLFLVGKADSVRSLKDRYWVKANIWIIIFSYVGNYFWTHYFFTVLGASYTSQVRGRRHHLDLHGYIDRILCLQGIDQVPPLRPSVAALTFLPRSRHCRLSASPSLAQEPPSSSLSRSRRPRPRRLGRIQKFLENMVRHHAALQKKTNHQDPCHLSRFMNKHKSYCATLSYLIIKRNRAAALHMRCHPSPACYGNACSTAAPLPARSCQ